MSLVMRKPAFCIYATRIVQSLSYLNSIFQASSYLLWFHSLVCVGPGRKPRKPVFSQRGSYCLNFQCTPYGTSKSRNAPLASAKIDTNIMQTHPYIRPTSHPIMLTCPCNVDPFTFFFHIIKSGVYIIYYSILHKRVIIISKHITHKLPNT